ncbi:hypothetical protein Kyoto28A_09220 [Helicobacter pylori]
MHVHIDRGIEDKRCEKIYKNECKQRTVELRESTRRCLNECKEQFSKDIKEDIGQFEERIKDSLTMLNHINLDSGFDPKFNIHSGIDKLGLFFFNRRFGSAFSDACIRWDYTSCRNSFRSNWDS